jgi:hypothetical protein
MNRIAFASVVLTTLLLTGCTTAPTPEGFVPIDRTADLAEALAETATSVEQATEIEPGRLDIQTNLVDPGGDDNSAEASTAVMICNAAVSLGYIDYVSVMEADGTSFVLFGHPSVPEGTCTEV